MDKRFKVLVGLICLLLALLAAVVLIVSFWDRIFPKSEEAGESGRVEVATPTTETVSLREETEKYRIEVDFPSFLGNENAVKASVALSGEIQAVVEQFKARANEVTGDYPIELKSELIIDYNVVLLNSKLASVRLVGSEYITGAAHPNNYYLTFNYDFDPQKELKFSDLFNKGSNYLKIVSDRVIADLKNREADLDWIEEGAGPRAENYQKFTLSRDTLIIYFDPYQVAAYAAGGQEVRIPYEDISAILRAELIEAVRLD